MKTRYDDGYRIVEIETIKTDDGIIVRTKEFVRLGSTIKLVKEREEEVEGE